MYYSTNPIGLSSLCAVVISAVAWFAVELGYRNRERWRSWIIVLAPLLLLAEVTYTKVKFDSSEFGIGYDWHISRYADTPDFFAQYVFVVVSVVLALKAFRMTRNGIKALALLELGIALGFLLLEIFCTFGFASAINQPL
jgi:hypothetical protein